MFIVMTGEQAGAVKGISGEYARLEPVKIKGGLYVLGVDVLADPAHLSKRSTLMEFPVREIDESEWLGEN